MYLSVLNSELENIVHYYVSIYKIIYAGYNFFYDYHISQSISCIANENIMYSITMRAMQHFQNVHRKFN